jgi:CrcB protein
MTSYAAMAIVSVGLGAAMGAWLRWGLSLWLNSTSAQLPLGTLSANLIGGYLVGVAIAFFIRHPELAPQWRLFLITGFLGGLTTFSAFSTETVELLLRGQYAYSVLIVVVHLGGSLLLATLGMRTYTWVRG